LAKKAGGLTTDADRACSNGRSEENKCSYGTSTTVGRIYT